VVGLEPHVANFEEQNCSLVKFGLVVVGTVGDIVAGEVFCRVFDLEFVDTDLGHNSDDIDSKPGPAEVDSFDRVGIDSKWDHVGIDSQLGLADNFDTNVADTGFYLHSASKVRTDSGKADIKHCQKACKADWSENFEYFHLQGTHSVDCDSDNFQNSLR